MSLSDVSCVGLGLAMGLKPDPRYSLPDWADKFRVLSSKSSSEPGRWRTSRTPYLKKIMECLSSDSPYQEVVFMAGAQVGKPLALDTEVPTPDGFKKISEIHAGDKVFAPDGSVCDVLGDSPVFNEECYEIEFSCGEKIVTDHRHLWTLENLSKKKWIRRTVTSAEIFSKYKTPKRSLYRIAVTEPLKIPKKELPIDPYTLGVWLGDGHSYSSILHLNKHDADEICSRIRWHHKVEYGKEVRGTRIVYLDRNTLRERFKNSFTKKTSELGVLKNKHIPEMYLFSSTDQRMDLLRGLMDTDGYCARGMCEIISVRQEMAEQIHTLVSSLGMKPRTSIKKVNGKNYYRVVFKSYSERSVFYLSRKKKNETSKHDYKSRLDVSFNRSIASVRRIEKVPTKCIAVNSPENLFLITKSFIATHNSECGMNWIGYIIDKSPAPILLVQPTVDLAKKFSQQRITPMIESTEVLHGKVTEKKSRETGNTVLLKTFEGGMILLTGANSPTGLRSMPIRFIFLDEIDAYPDDAGGEGDPVDLAVKRSATFSKRKIFKSSTPTTEEHSKITRAYNATDQQKFYVPCPDCSEMQTLEFDKLTYDKDQKGDPILSTVRYVCTTCGVLIPEHKKTEMLLKGEWRATKPHKATKKKIGFHLNSLYSPVGWYSWADAVDDHHRAQGNVTKMKTFVNTVLGLPWKDKGDAPDWKRLYDRRENYPIGTVPYGAVILTAAVDVQKDRLEVEVKGWGRAMRSWSVDYRHIIGDTQQAATWLQLDSILSEEFTHESGVPMRIAKMVVDSGFNTQRVYNWVRGQSPQRVIAVKGADGLQQVLSNPRAVDVRADGKKISRGARVCMMGSSLIKLEIFSWLKAERGRAHEADPYGYARFPQYGEEFFEGLASEQLVKKKLRGFDKFYWEKIKDRNEPLDLFVMNRAAAYAIGLDRYKEVHWQKLECIFPAPKNPIEKTIEVEDNAVEDGQGAGQHFQPTIPETPKNLPVHPMPQGQIRRIKRRPSSFW